MCLCRFAIASLLLMAACAAPDVDSGPVAERAAPLTTETGACKVSYETLTTWPGGYTAEVTVTSKTRALPAWKLEWNLPAGTSIASVWEAAKAQTGTRVSFTGLPPATALAKGASVTFGIEVTDPGAIGWPARFDLDGVSCTLPACHGGVWQLFSVYAPGDWVVHNGVHYRASFWNQGQIPTAYPAVWGKIDCAP
jgi:hypothetical protein